MENSIDDKEVIFYVAFLAGTDVGGAHVAVNGVILVIVFFDFFFKDF